MRRNTVLLALFLLVAPAAARYVVSTRDAEAVRCALACVRAGMAAGKGAACCPMGHGPGVATMSSCAHDDGAAPLPGTALMLLAAALLLIRPSATRGRPLALSFALPSAPARLPDKVPLLLG